MQKPNFELFWTQDATNFLGYKEVREVQEALLCSEPHLYETLQQDSVCLDLRPFSLNSSCT
jgi:hypothetical protein